MQASDGEIQNIHAVQLVSQRNLGAQWAKKNVPEPNNMSLDDRGAQNQRELSQKATTSLVFGSLPTLRFIFGVFFSSNEEIRRRCSYLFKRAGRPLLSPHPREREFGLPELANDDHLQLERSKQNSVTRELTSRCERVKGDNT